MYRRPDIHYTLEPPTADSTNTDVMATRAAAAKRVDDEIQPQLSVPEVDLIDSSKAGRLYQYVRSVVLAIYTHGSKIRLQPMARWYINRVTSREPKRRASSVQEDGTRKARYTVPKTVDGLAPETKTKTKQTRHVNFSR